ncbi:MAG: aspartate aminotransferase family protein, partial [Alphaproteobacteria bacterium]|nr:aspartate aminotransferase family protein [Alphaproteobacteria bacterium]
NSLGHAHPHLVKALQGQAAKLWHTSNLYTVPEQTRLADRLVAASFADTVFFCNSGVEAMEGGIKLCRRYHHVGGNPRKWRILTFNGAFHGRSLATLAAANNAKHLEGFGPKVDGFDQVAFNNLNEVRAAVTDETAAILVEPIQGEGGIRKADLRFMKELRAVCDEFGLLLFLDEIQCGMGRTGKLFAHEWAEIEPDVVASAKGIGSGFPLGAILAKEEAARGMTAGLHGTTYGGNQLATTVGNAVMDVMLSDGFLDNVHAMGESLYGRLEAIVKMFPEVFKSVRGAGLMLGLECMVPGGEMVVALRDAGLLTVPAAENVVRILPPLIIEQAHIDEAAAIIEKVAAAWKADK